MDQRSMIGTSLPLDRPIHRACVVPGCWCGSTTATVRSAKLAGERAPETSPIRRIDATSTNLTDIA
jgi:hypothetical protein